MTFYAADNSQNTSALQTSATGTSWTGAGSVPYDTFNDFIVADGYLLLVAQGKVYRSAIGSGTWATVISSAAIGYTITYGGGVMLYDNGLNLYRSTDKGATWTTYASTNSYALLSYKNGTFISVAGYSNQTLTSTDGITWTTHVATAPPSPNVWAYGAITVSGNNWVMTPGVHNGATALIASSSDGITFSFSASPVLAAGTQLLLLSGTSRIVATNGIAAGYYSDDNGSTWTSFTPPFTMTGLGCQNGTFVTSWYTTGKYYSSNGTTYTLATGGNTDGSIFARDLSTPSTTKIVMMV